MTGIKRLPRQDPTLVALCEEAALQARGVRDETLWLAVADRADEADHPRAAAYRRWVEGSRRAVAAGVPSQHRRFHRPPEAWRVPGGGALVLYALVSLDHWGSAALLEPLLSDFRETVARVELDVLLCLRETPTPRHSPPWEAPSFRLAHLPQYRGPAHQDQPTGAYGAARAVGRAWAGRGSLCGLYGELLTYWATACGFSQHRRVVIQESLVEAGPLFPADLPYGEELVDIQNAMRARAYAH